MPTPRASTTRLGGPRGPHVAGPGPGTRPAADLAAAGRTAHRGPGGDRRRSHLPGPPAVHARRAVLLRRRRLSARRLVLVPVLGDAAAGIGADRRVRRLGWWRGRLRRRLRPRLRGRPGRCRGPRLRRGLGLRRRLGLQWRWLGLQRWWLGLRRRGRLRRRLVRARCGGWPRRPGWRGGPAGGSRRRRPGWARTPAVPGSTG